MKAQNINKRLLCTKDTDQISQKTGLLVDFLQFGKEYHGIVQVESDDFPDRIGYILAELGPRVAMGAEFFTPLDDQQDETDIAYERLKADAAEMNAMWGTFHHKPTDQ